MQVTGPRSFASDASYVYNGTAAQVTGNALPGQVRNLRTTNANDVTLTAPVSIMQVVAVGNTGNLVLNGNALTLLSGSVGTALAINSSSGVVSGSTAVVQRYIDPSLNAGLGYRHYGAPVSGSTVADLSTAGFMPIVNSLYNSSSAPGTTLPFPTVFGYSESRATTTTTLSDFDRGWYSPASLADALTPGIGYTVNIGAAQLVDFTGTLTTGTQSLTLHRSSNALPAAAGWALVSNPYPAPLDYSLVAAADRVGLDAAIYVFSSTSQYAGQYRAYTNGIGGNPVLPVAQGFFVRVSTGQTDGALTFRNSQRMTLPDATSFQRTTADPRPLVQLMLAGATGPADVFYAYAEAGATAATDAQYDAIKLPNSTGLNLSSVTALGEHLAIDGRPAFGAATSLPLAVGVPAAGIYTLTAAALSNLPVGLDAYLTDAQAGQTLKLSAGTSYAFRVTEAQATSLLTGRFTLQFSPQAVLATVPVLTAELVGIYPNPAHGRFTVTLPGAAPAGVVQADLLNTLGQVVLRQAASLPAAGTQLTLETGSLPAGVYTLRLTTGPVILAKRVVIY
ncbi:T9SS type A sorting domain-containing protein [Hymenobacter sp. BRD67]|uniref:T9SS type A sorting domain-containing protein n=1 Tax=Hymenobacter sp. BRD67 TaxID=2675877 RepID=UPI001565D9A0|nr:T9SS type A sorting domain-containing protein [Hymenobacter sp. BRD67]QKG54352.1 T9SS type A sorting domain-containing protein [Hymenobacter sp. BRD67]